MDGVEWEEYLNIPPASDKDIQRIESLFSIVFPEEFKQILKSVQGKAPFPEIIESEEVCEVPFGPIFHVLSEVKPSYSIEHVKNRWNQYYPNLLPIADSGDGCFFAYDLSEDKEKPPVIFVNAEADPEDEDSEGILFVAHNLTELLSNLKDE
jgi:SMI1 / KNR4 family (SUKH-1)